jgi:hypothetical protein
MGGGTADRLPFFGKVTTCIARVQNGFGAARTPGVTFPDGPGNNPVAAHYESRRTLP